MKRHDKDRGAALITVLVMLAVMSTLAVLVVQAAGLATRRAANQAQLTQARWFLQGAEAFAAGRLDELARRNTEAPVPASAWQGVPFTFPLDQGVMQVTLWDGGNCFNLNSVVERSGSGALVGVGRGQVQFARLMDMLDVRGADAGLIPALVDWIDSDSSPRAGGAERESYATPDAPYQPGNTLMADISELSRVHGFTPAIVARLAPFVCVRPSELPNTINPNTLTTDQAPLLAMGIGPSLSRQAAQSLIANRPRDGWVDLDAFFAALSREGVDVNEPTRALFSTTTRYYVMSARVTYRDVTETSAALIETQGVSRVVRRVYGAYGNGRVL